MNTVQLMGRITKDLDIKTSASGISVLRFTLAVNRQYVKEGEERQTDFISCIAFAKTANHINKYFGKGSLMAIEGSIQTGSYEKDGRKIYTTDIVVSKAHFCGKSEKKGADSEAIISEFSEEELPF